MDFSTFGFNDHVLSGMDAAKEILTRSEMDHITIIDSCSISVYARMEEAAGGIVETLVQEIAHGNVFLISTTVFCEVNAGNGISETQKDFINALAAEEHPVLIVDEEIGYFIEKSCSAFDQRKMNEDYANLMNHVVLPKSPAVATTLCNADRDSGLPLVFTEKTNRKGQAKTTISIKSVFQGDSASAVGQYLRRNLCHNLGEEMSTILVYLMKWYLATSDIKVTYISEDNGAQQKFEDLINSERRFYIQKIMLKKSLHTIQRYFDHHSDDVTYEQISMLFEIAAKRSTIARLTVSQISAGANEKRDITLEKIEAAELADCIYNRVYKIS